MSVTACLLENESMTAFFDVIAIDLDGTLVDSVADLHTAINAMQAALGLPYATESQVRNWVGNGVERLVHRALTNTMDNDASSLQFNQALPLFEQSYESVSGNLSVLYPGVEIGLDWLASTNAPLCVVTNKARRFTIPLLQSLGIWERFEHCIAGDDVTEKKPHPSALFEAARLCSVPSNNGLLIGDSVSDIKAARGAGFKCVAVSYGYNHGTSVRDLPTELQPDAIVDSFDELSEVVTRLSAAV